MMKILINVLMLYRSEKDNMAEKTGIYNRDYHRKIVFPYHLYNINFTSSRFYTDEICHIKKHSTLHNFLESLTFSKVYAAEDVSKKDVPQPAYNRTIPTELLENVARAYIANETGMERINMFFKKNSNDKDSQELGMIKLVILQTLVLSFFMGYVPEWKLAKEDFIRNHRGTVFRTRLEAIQTGQIGQDSFKFRHKTEIYEKRWPEFSASAGLNRVCPRLDRVREVFGEGTRSVWRGYAKCLLEGYATCLARVRDVFGEVREVFGEVREVFGEVREVFGEPTRRVWRVLVSVFTLAVLDSMFTLAVLVSVFTLAVLRLHVYISSARLHVYISSARLSVYISSASLRGYSGSARLNVYSGSARLRVYSGSKDEHQA
ncbi:hypothetical protein Btru_036163 [Bulinus truncatus]|nr:hypothetical protein Btru_036163 [Bulinus truncatus]